MRKSDTINSLPQRGRGTAIAVDEEKKCNSSITKPLSRMLKSYEKI